MSLYTVIVTGDSFKIVMGFVVKHFQGADIYPVLLRWIPIAPGGFCSLIEITLNAPEMNLQCKAMGLLSYFSLGVFFTFFFFFLIMS